jgi:hypothetical protein
MKEGLMDTNLLFGVFALLFGVVTLVGRFVAPQSALFAKLGPMKERFGDTAGLVIHVVAYTVMPLMLGGALVAASLVGG